MSGDLINRGTVITVSQRGLERDWRTVLTEC